MHVPVLLTEAIKYLDPQPDENFIDATFGEGGHSAAILKKNGPEGKVLGLEADPELFRKFGIEPAQKEEFFNRLLLVNSSYTKLKELIGVHHFRPVAGILFDLGLSSWHLEESGRGFSFLRDEPLDMRFDPSSGDPTASRLINELREEELINIFRNYGEERYSRSIAKKIIEERKQKFIRGTAELADLVERATPTRYHHGRIHPATRIFQALRIAVNRELENLEDVLGRAAEILAPGGRIVVISFHSLEDRIVKNFFRQEAKKGGMRILTKKPVTAGDEEIKNNPRARSAKLRAALKESQSHSVAWSSSRSIT